MALYDIPQEVLFESFKTLYKKWINKHNRSGWIKEVVGTKKDILSTKMKLDKETDPTKQKKLFIILALLNKRYVLSKQVLTYMERAHKNDTWKKSDKKLWQLIDQVDSIDEKIYDLKHTK